MNTPNLQLSADGALLDKLHEKALKDLPISMMTIFGLACWRASSSQVVKWLKVSRLGGGKTIPTCYIRQQP